jgi:hypothetical protein
MDESPEDVDWVVVQRGLDGQKVQASKAEKIAITNAWRDAGRSLNELSRIQGWQPWRYTETAA